MHPADLTNQVVRLCSIGGQVVALMLDEYKYHFTPLLRLDCRLLNEACGIDVSEQGCLHWEAAC